MQQALYEFYSRISGHPQKSPSLLLRPRRRFESQIARNEHHGATKFSRLTKGCRRTPKCYRCVSKWDLSEIDRKRNHLEALILRHALRRTPVGWGNTLKAGTLISMEALNSGNPRSGGGTPKLKRRKLRPKDRNSFMKPLLRTEQRKAPLSPGMDSSFSMDLVVKHESAYAQKTCNWKELRPSASDCMTDKNLIMPFSRLLD